MTRGSFRRNVAPRPGPWLSSDDPTGTRSGQLASLNR